MLCRQQLPVGKILPEVRRPERNLPKPIGYRYTDKTLKQYSPWNADFNRSFDTLDKRPSFDHPSNLIQSVNSSWPEENCAPFHRIEGHESSRDWFGLRSLASELSSPEELTIHPRSSHSRLFNNSGIPPIRDTWNFDHVTDEQTENAFMSSLHSSSGPLSRDSGLYYSPWSVPHWLDVSQLKHTVVRTSQGVTELRDGLSITGNQTDRKPNSQADSRLNVREMWDTTNEKPTDSWPPPYSHF